MKKIGIIGLMLLLLVAFAGLAQATPKMLPDGAVVSAEISGSTATVNIRGAKVVDVEYYGYEGVKHLGAVNTFTVNLREGRRFNFVFRDGGEYYALITPDMHSYPPDFFGSGVAPECTNPDGCCFVITAKAKRK
jgi:hypothetical protein